MDEEVRRFLLELLAAVPPGQRIRLNTLRVSAGRRPRDGTGQTEGIPGKAGSLSRESRAAVDGCLHDPARFREFALGDPAVQRLLYRRDETTLARRRWETADRRSATVDINNLLWTFSPPGLRRNNNRNKNRELSTGTDSAAGTREETARDRKPSPEHATGLVLQVLAYLRRCGVQRIAGIADASVESLTGADDRAALVTALDYWEVAPAGTPADPLILDRAQIHGGLVVSNDAFREWGRRSPPLRRLLSRLRVPVTVEGEGFSCGEPGRELEDAIAQEGGVYRCR